MNPRCPRIARHLDAYLDGELGWLTRARVRRHLARCEACRAELEELRRLQERLRQAFAEPALEWALWERLAPRLPAARSAAERGAPAVRRPGWGRRRWTCASLAAGAVAAALGLVLLRGTPWRSRLPGFRGPVASPAGDVVQSLYSFGHPVVVLGETDGTTVIWLVEHAPVEEGKRSGEGGGAARA